MPRLAMICRADNSGLGTLSWEFYRHLKPVKVLLVSNGVFQTFPERYEATPNRISRVRGISPDDLSWLTKDVDILLSFETFYDWDVLAFCRSRLVKTILVTMFEMTPVRLPMTPNAFICPSELDQEVFASRWPNVPSTYLPIPVDTDRLHWNERKTARTFVHTASHGGMNGRKGTGLLLEAIKRVKSKDAKFIINTWSGLVVDDSRVEVRNVNYKNYWQAWRDGDVLVYPQDYNGICLPVLEAFCSGLGVCTTDIYPFNRWLPLKALFKPEAYYETSAASGLITVKAAKINPNDIAAKIDELVGKDISDLSSIGKAHAEKYDWKNWESKWLSTIANI